MLELNGISLNEEPNIEQFEKELDLPRFTHRISVSFTITITQPYNATILRLLGARVAFVKVLGNAPWR